MNNVVWLSLDPEIPAAPYVYWDTTLISSLLTGCQHHLSVGNLKEALVIIPGAYQGKYINNINDELSKLERCKVIITSDEENNFPIDELSHPNMEVYATYLTDKYKRDIKWLPIGPARLPKIEYQPKKRDWFYAGQVNHESRYQLVEVLKTLDSGSLLVTGGFAQGMDHDEYYDWMSGAKAVPAPRGNISPDSFRFYEALELGAVPIPENKEWWGKLFPDMPMEVCEDWSELPRIMNKPITDQAYRNQCVAWWQR
jgi:hypothetical protein